MPADEAAGELRGHGLRFCVYANSPLGERLISGGGQMPAGGAGTSLFVGGQMPHGRPPCTFLSRPSEGYIATMRPAGERPSSPPEALARARSPEATAPSEPHAFRIFFALDGEEEGDTCGDGR